MNVAKEDLVSHQCDMQLKGLITADMRLREKELLLNYVKLCDAEEEFFSSKI